MIDYEKKFDTNNIHSVELNLLDGQVEIIYGSDATDELKQEKIAMLKYTYEQVLSDQAEQVNTKRNNTNNLTAYGQKMINDSNIINMIPKNKDIRAV